MRNRFLIRSSFTDLLALGVAMVGASIYVYGTVLPWNSRRGSEVFPMVAFIMLSMIVFSLLTAQMSGPGVPRPSYGRMFAIALGTSALTAMLLLFSREYFSRAFLGVTAVGWLVLATAHRIVRRRRPWTERIALITGEKQLADDLTDSAHAEVVWVLDPKSEGLPDLPDRDVTLAVDLREVLSEKVAQFVSSSDVAGYAIRPFTSTYEEHTGRVPLVHLAEGWEISAPLLEVAPWLPGKRVFDTLFALVTAPIWLALGLLVSAYIRVATRGPALFRQRRIGYEGRPFTIYKFRTMDEDAEKDGPRFATEDDGRLIRGGKFLRKSRLDEIPQLWNVLKGEMSLVGPRAEQVPFVETFRKQIPFYEHRHLVRPGITGWAQVNYRYADDQADTIEKLTYDLYYIKHMSPVMDLRVLWKSVWTVLTGAGAR
ncbi:MAG TPA: exopolysaccharide biosynthesis polyprenyl glycosylphosphotransferase [Acidimicrobiia bacterium]